MPHFENEYLNLILQAFKHKEYDEHRIPDFLNSAKRKYDISKEKLKHVKAVQKLREGNFQQAELESYQLLYSFKKDLNLIWNDDYFKFWIISKLLMDEEQHLKSDCGYIINEINKIINFEHLNKNPIYFQLLIFDVLEHELLEDYLEDLVSFGANLFIKIIASIDWSDEKVVKLIVEKVFFKREMFGKFNPVIIEYINELINHFKPSNSSELFYKTYLFYVEASILFKNKRYIGAKKIIKNIFNSFNENEIYTTYHDINDLSLEIFRYLDRPIH